MEASSNTGGLAVVNTENEESGNVLIAEAVTEIPATTNDSAALKAIVEAAIYITDEPLTAEQIASATEQPLDRIQEILQQLVGEYAAP
ncbi:MAG: hypothetical protein JO028_01455, partial [Acidobacteriaceae bacterium]|nr:hypothetical protein [Acidobacteriaceae bacterium]